MRGFRRNGCAFSPEIRIRARNPGGSRPHRQRQPVPIQGLAPRLPDSRPAPPPHPAVSPPDHPATELAAIRWPQSAAASRSCRLGSLEPCTPPLPHTEHPFGEDLLSSHLTHFPSGSELSRAGLMSASSVLRSRPDVLVVGRRPVSARDSAGRPAPPAHLLDHPM